MGCLRKIYTTSIIQWVHKDINVMKWAFSMEKFYHLCELVLTNKEKYIEARPLVRIDDYKNHFGPRVNLSL